MQEVRKTRGMGNLTCCAFAFGEGKGAFQAQVQKEPKSSRFLDLHLLGRNRQGVAPRAYCSVRPEGGRSSTYNPSKASCRSSGAQVRRNLGTSHPATAQWEGDVNTQEEAGWELTLLKPAAGPCPRLLFLVTPATLRI